MAFSINELKSNLKQGGARPSLFAVNLQFPTFVGNPPTRSVFLVRAASLPASTIGTAEVFFHGKSIKVASDRSFETWDTTIFNDEDFGIRIALEKWINYMGNNKINSRRLVPATELEGDAASYKQTIQVTQFGKDGEPLYTYDFVGAFPTSVQSIPLDWGTDGIEEYSCTWSYDYHRLKAGGISGTNYTY